MVRTQSFTDILDDLGTQDGAEADAAASRRSYAEAARQGLWFSFFATQAESAATDREAAAAGYADIDPENAPGMADIEPADEDRIAAELDLDAAVSLADLNRARRSFALRNHPDLFHPRLRALANCRMQLANMLLDRRRREIDAGR